MVCGKQVLRETTAFAAKEIIQADVVRGTSTRGDINLSVPGILFVELDAANEFDVNFHFV